MTGSRKSRDEIQTLLTLKSGLEQLAGMLWTPLTPWRCQHHARRWADIIHGSIHLPQAIFKINLDFWLPVISCCIPSRELFVKLCFWCKDIVTWRMSYFSTQYSLHLGWLQQSLSMLKQCRKWEWTPRRGPQWRVVFTSSHMQRKDVMFWHKKKYIFGVHPQFPH